MKRILIIGGLLFCSYIGRAQKTLPEITVTNINGNIVVSWKNEYTKPIATLNIQRSYDSLKNYTTIGSVLNPQNIENGYSDQNPPYNKMYYRLFIAFEGGTYIMTTPARPVKLIQQVVVKTEDGKDSIVQPVERYPWLSSQTIDSMGIIVPQPIKPNLPTNPTVPTNPNIPIPPVKPLITYPSKRIFTSRDNSVVIHLPDAANKKYIAKFYNDKEEKIFELTKLNEEYLIIEKVNFVRSGWYSFEIFENGELIEKNKFFVPKDPKKPNQ